ncbi:cell wall-binding repeat-containing protein [Clostridium magnum]|uniref:N-acetylmuramoyl-L-alanine amidase LytC n=1 Tax=Clostridium magnum DSM 2767 TaxID=1121326 RepID=A0A161X7R1_9CLOT|nr:cell wall-binding repeat-containing protein [Clostridium magnum]KZL90186.1 N-acetylmuramoyl-L-alanine amidase LytC precursor [Clostridium magnum DSM 2767]SHH63743.1 Putative cell wall binding repeat 2 [Clostridium magnum DSM 2767]
MQINYTKSMKRAFILSLVLTASLQAAPTKAAAGQVTSIGGADCYETAAKVATANWTSATDVVLVCGEGYADAVSATVLAKQLNAPILLTTTESLHANARAALDTLKPQNIYIIGGNASISQSVRTNLKNENYNLIELSGKNRYETNIAVANQLVKLGVSADSVMLVSGDGFADVLSATPVAAAKGQILLLGNNSTSSMEPVLDFVKTNNSNVTVVGTNNAIKDDIYKALGAVKRINGGANRFETNINVLNEFKDDLKTDKLFIANASGGRYTDALIASSLAGKWSTPLVLVDDETSDSTSKAIDYIKGKISSSTDLSAIGETGVISDTIVSRINSSISSSVENNYSPTVKSVSTNGLNQIKVEFNTPVDESSAEQIQNYSIEGSSLGSNSETESSANLQEDGKTVLITFAHPFQQYKTVNFMVKNSILDLSLKNTISKYEQKITFSDISAPSLESITPVGGNKLVLKFSEPIRMTISNLSSMKINRQSIANYGLNSAQTVFDNKSGDWSDKVELYFDSSLPVGSNVFTMPNGDLGKKFDNAAGFPILGSSNNFTINSISGVPKVTNVTTDNAKTIFITYDRSMDRQTALQCSNYKLNGSVVSVSSSNISFVEGSNDCIVKIKRLDYILKDGSNHLEINNNITDTYGNSIKTSSLDFIYGDDSLKPQITSASVRDGKTLRIKFNKDVQDYYATNKANYKISDSDGKDISYRISSINKVYDSNGGNNNIYDITFKDADALKGYKYTLTVSNILDTGTNPNVMDTYTGVVTGLDKQLPDVTSIVKSTNDEQEVVVFFNRSMDESSITDTSNYFYQDGSGNTQRLPRTATVSAGIDGRYAIIDFPTSCKIRTGSDDRYVIKLGVQNIKDKDGRIMTNMSYSGEISTDYYNGPKLIDNTARLYYSGNDIKVRFSLTSPLDILNLSDFKVAGETPDSAITDSNDVILTYRAGVNDNEKITSIQSEGTSTTLSISNTKSVDAAGRKLGSSSDVVLLPPITHQDSWIAHSSGGGYNTVTITFDQYIDDTIKSSYNDDFIFTNETTGQKLKVSYVTVSNQNVIFNFDNGTMKLGDNISVHANSDTSLINIRDKDHVGDYEIYSPTLDDINGKTIVVR